MMYDTFMKYIKCVNELLGRDILLNIIHHL